MYKNFQRETQKAFRLFLNVPIASQLKIGDYGTQDGDMTFTMRGNLSDEGVAIQTRNRANSDKLSIKSENGVTFTLETDGKTIPVNVDLSINFQNKDSVFINVGEQNVTQITNLVEIENELIRRRKLDQWDNDLIVITSLYSSGNIVLAGSSAANAEVKFGTKIDNAGIDVLTTANVNWSLTKADNTNSEYCSISVINVFYGAHKLKKVFLRDKHVLEPEKGRYMGIDASEDNFELSEYIVEKF